MKKVHRFFEFYLLNKYINIVMVLIKTFRIMNKVKISIVFKKKWLPLTVCSKREAKSIIKNIEACGTEYKVENYNED